MDKLENINKVEQILVDCEAITTTLNVMYYKKRLNEIEKYQSIEIADIKFKKCRDLLKDNLKKLKYSLDVNFNLFLALSVHLAVMSGEIEKLKLTENNDTEDPLTVKEEDVESNNDDEIGEAVKNIIFADSSDSSDSSSSDSSDTD